jgi:hypothetical protein
MVNDVSAYFKRNQRIACGTIEMLEQKVCHLKQTNFYTKLNVALS